MLKLVEMCGAVILVATMLAIVAISIALAQETEPGDRVYVLHSEAQGTCPALDWHIVASPSGGCQACSHGRIGR